MAEILNSSSAYVEYHLFIFIPHPQFLETILKTVQDNLKCLVHAPSVQMQDVPPDLLSLEETKEPDPDSRPNDLESK